MPPTFGPGEIQSFLETGAADLGAAGKDNETGAGQLRLPDLRDTTPPAAKALATTGRKGSVVKLLAQIADDVGEYRLAADTGQLSLREQLKQNGKVVATLHSRVTAPQSVIRVATPWKAPTKIAGSFQHCVRATDPQGNASLVTCARITLR
jgi:hypothetical protein